MVQGQYRLQTGFGVLPPVIKNLLIINGLVYFAQVTPVLRDFIFEWFALWPLGTPEVVRTLSGLEHVPRFWPWQVVSYAFLHGGIAHIFFNMYGLWLFGMNIERTMGSRRFAWYYFICAAGAGAVQLGVAYLSGGIYPTVGASGGVMGVLLAFGMLYPDQELYLLFLPVPIKAKWLVIGYAILDLTAGVTGSEQGVANFAHLGGMAFGLVLILYWRGRLPIQPKARVYF